MKFAIKTRTIIVGLILITTIIIASFLLLKGEQIHSKDMAISIANEYVSEKYEKAFTDYETTAVLEDGIWIVSYSEETNSNLLGGGLPVVKIKQSNGKVISCLLQK